MKTQSINQSSFMRQNDKGQRNAVFGSILDTVTPDGNVLVGPCISSSKNAKMSHPGKVSGIEVTG